MVGLSAGACDAPVTPAREIGEDGRIISCQAKNARYAEGITLGIVLLCKSRCLRTIRRWQPALDRRWSKE